VPAAAAARAAARADDTLETRIGSRLLLYVGIAAVVLAVGFFVKYAFDNEWINETARVVLGGLAGAALVALGYRLAARGYDRYGEVLAGGGFVAMYVSTWAALNLYELLARPTVFGLMVLITAGAALMADRLRSPALAVVSVLGGFFTPALVGGREDRQVVLLSYAAILVAGTMVLAARRGWTWLNFLSYVLTLMLFGGWASVHYAAGKYAWTQAFLVLFAGMFGWSFLRAWRNTDVRDNPLPAVALGSVPLVFHVASVANLADHSLPLLVYVIAMTLAGVLVSVHADRPWIRLVTFVAVTPVSLAWLGEHRSSSWLAAGLVVVVVQYAMYLAAQGERLVRQQGPWRRGDLVLFHANALALFAGLYILTDAHWPYWTGALAAALAAWQGTLAWRAKALSGEAGVNGLAAAFAMAGFAIGLQFGDWWSMVGWALEAAAIYWAGLRTGRRWMRLGGLALLAFVLVHLLMMDFFGTPAGFAPVLNERAGATLVIVMAMYAMSWFLRRAIGAAAARGNREYAALLIAANVLSVLLVSVEINSYWHGRSAEDATASLALLASLSIAWGLYGTALLVVGIQRRFAPLRYLAIGILLVTVAKVFLVDLSELGGIYRIAGFLGLGVCLLLGAWLYQRYRDVILGTED
jgi:uncharacterized membrane protein